MQIVQCSKHGSVSHWRGNASKIAAFGEANHSSGKITYTNSDGRNSSENFQVWFDVVLHMNDMISSWHWFKWQSFTENHYDMVQKQT